MKHFKVAMLLEDGGILGAKIQAKTLVGAVAAAAGLVDVQVKPVKGIQIEETKLSELVAATFIPPDDPLKINGAVKS